MFEKIWNFAENIGRAGKVTADVVWTIAGNAPQLAKGVFKAATSTDYKEAQDGSEALIEIPASKIPEFLESNPYLITLAKVLAFRQAPIITSVVIALANRRAIGSNLTLKAVLKNPRKLLLPVASLLLARQLPLASAMKPEAGAEAGPEAGAEAGPEAGYDYSPSRDWNFLLTLLFIGLAGLITRNRESNPEIQYARNELQTNKYPDEKQRVGAAGFPNMDNNALNTDDMDELFFALKVIFDAIKGLEEKMQVNDKDFFLKEIQETNQSKLSLPASDDYSNEENSDSDKAKSGDAKANDNNEFFQSFLDFLEQERKDYLGMFEKQAQNNDEKEKIYVDLLKELAGQGNKQFDSMLQFLQEQWQKAKQGTADASLGELKSFVEKKFDELSQKIVEFENKTPEPVVPQKQVQSDKESQSASDLELRNQEMKAKMEELEKDRKKDKASIDAIKKQLDEEKARANQDRQNAFFVTLQDNQQKQMQRMQDKLDKTNKEHKDALQKLLENKAPSHDPEHQRQIQDLQNMMKQEQGRYDQSLAELTQQSRAANENLQKQLEKERNKNDHNNTNQVNQLHAKLEELAAGNKQVNNSNDVVQLKTGSKGGAVLGVGLLATVGSSIFFLATGTGAILAIGLAISSSVGGGAYLATSKNKVKQVKLDKQIPSPNMQAANGVELVGGGYQKQ